MDIPRKAQQTLPSASMPWMSSLADESPIYTSEAFQAVLQQSRDDIKAGRVVEMTPEQL